MNIIKIYMYVIADGGCALVDYNRLYIMCMCTIITLCTYSTGQVVRDKDESSV